MISPVPQMIANDALQSSQNIIQKNDLSPRIDRASQSDPGLLTTTQGKSLFAYFRFVSGFKQ